MQINNSAKLVIAVVVSELAGIIGAVFTTPSITGWYSGIVKPSFNPPAWVFGPVWTTLFALMGIAAFLIWKKGLDRRDVKIALAIFIGQLVLNTLWSIIFFGLHNPGLAFVEIIFLWLAILATIVSFAQISKPAAWLLVPYILWVSFAGFLNYTIWQLNSQAVPPSDYKNISYVIDGQSVQLGANDSLKYFGNEVKADIDGDGREDVGFLVTQDGGGSGTFFYVVAALNTGNGYRGTNGVLLGDRIAPQTTEIQNGKLLVNYADRKPSDPMTTAPSVGVSSYFSVQNGELVKVESK